MIKDMLEYNRIFVKNKMYEPYMTSKYPDKKVLYITMNHFYSEFINALRGGKGDDFVKKYQKFSP